MGAPREVKCLVIHASDEAIYGPMTSVEIKDAVAGWLEGVGPNRVVAGLPAWYAYCDEEGKLKRLPVNWVATKLARLAGWMSNDVLCGTVVFVGAADDYGNSTHVPQALIDLGVREGLLIA